MTGDEASSKGGTAKIQGDAPQEDAKKFYETLEKWGGRIKTGALLGRLGQWWASKTPEEQWAFYRGEDLSDQTFAVVRADYDKLKAAYGEALVPAAILAFSRLSADEQRQHVWEASGKSPRREPEQAARDMVRMTILRIQAGKVTEAERMAILRALVTEPEGGEPSPPSKT